MPDHKMGVALLHILYTAVIAFPATTYKCNTFYYIVKFTSQYNAVQRRIQKTELNTSTLFFSSLAKQINTYFVSRENCDWYWTSARCRLPIADESINKFFSCAYIPYTYIFCCNLFMFSSQRYLLSFWNFWRTFRIRLFMSSNIIVLSVFYDVWSVVPFSHLLSTNEPKQCSRLMMSRWWCTCDK